MQGPQWEVQCSAAQAGGGGSAQHCTAQHSTAWEPTCSTARVHQAGCSKGGRGGQWRSSGADRRRPAVGGSSSRKGRQPGRTAGLSERRRACWQGLPYVYSSVRPAGQIPHQPAGFMPIAPSPNPPRRPQRPQQQKQRVRTDVVWGRVPWLDRARPPAELQELLPGEGLRGAPGKGEKGDGPRRPAQPQPRPRPRPAHSRCPGDLACRPAALIAATAASFLFPIQTTALRGAVILGSTAT